MAEPAILPFDWQDPFDLNSELTDEERLVRDTAEGYAQEKLQPRVTNEQTSFQYRCSGRKYRRGNGSRYHFKTRAEFEKPDE